MISREIAKQESSNTTDNNNSNNNNDNNSNNNISLKAATTSWSRLKDPRIVRVSRAFGGKDRHSKVCTVRGLRDRRVRLSVPTAIQLYDLQDRLGLNQPSKVVDWLLNAAKAEIDELPPLQFPHPTMLDNLNNQLDLKSKDHQDHHHSYLNQNQNQNQNQNPSSSTTSNIPFNSSFVRWDPSTLTLSHPPRSPNCSSSPHQQPAAEDWHNFSLVQPHHHHHHHQVLVYQPAAAMAAQPYFQSQISGSNADFSPSVEASTHFNIITANLLPSQNNDGSR